MDTGKVVNLHKFKMAAVQSLSLQITFLWLLLDPINVLQTTFLGFDWTITYCACGCATCGRDEEGGKGQKLSRVKLAICRLRIALKFCMRGDSYIFKVL